jgi:hypothetical protein
MSKDPGNPRRNTKCFYYRGYVCHSVSEHKVDRSFLQYMISGNWVSLAGKGFICEHWVSWELVLIFGSGSHLWELGLKGISTHLLEWDSFVEIGSHRN